ncbi:MAG: ATP-binding cassette domain-containing protein [Lentisphaerae bacterium]|jgi:phospholipid/cholesterol/gamma-HCH transport system ATP-binding protein|nr:ATP-binding cassette domain-containing protein [Lentisphaerota bacterium]
MIRFEEVTKRFGQKVVLKNVSYEVSEGEIFCIVGPSGTGKSVSLKLMIKLLSPTSGRVCIGDDCVSSSWSKDLSVLRSRFGYLFQSAALLAWMSVYENVALPLRERTKLTDAEIRDKVMDALEKVGLENDAETYPADLSGGMQKRTGLARAIVTEPEILLYDEPTSGLDPVTSRMIDDLIVELNERLGTTSVVVTHDMHSALSIADRIAMLHGGRVATIEAPQNFIKSEVPEVRSFLDAQYITRKGVWEKGN